MNTGRTHFKKGAVPWNKGLQGFGSEFLHRRGVAPWNKGLKGYNADLPRGEEWCKKISAAKKGHIVSDEARTKISAAQKGRVSNRKGTTHSEATKEKCRRARLAQVIPLHDTSIERKVREWIDRIGVDYSHPFNLGEYFQCDFYIPSLNLIIECDGQYWHRKPENQRRDRAKDTYARNHGFEMLRLTDMQINNGEALPLLNARLKLIL